jgi:hypothetical protein
LDYYEEYLAIFLDLVAGAAKYQKTENWLTHSNNNIIALPRGSMVLKCQFLNKQKTNKERIDKNEETSIVPMHVADRCDSSPFSGLCEPLS